MVPFSSGFTGSAWPDTELQGSRGSKRLPCQVPIQDRRRLGASRSHDDSLLRGPGQPGHRWLHSPAGAAWGGPGCPRPKPGCGWKHPRGCGRRQSVYPLGPSTRLWRGHRRPGSAQGRRPDPLPRREVGAPLPPRPIVRTRVGREHRPARKMTLGRKLPALPGRGAAAVKEAEAERRVGSSRGADASADLWSTGLPTRWLESQGPRLRFPPRPLRRRPPVTTAGRRWGGAPASRGVPRQPPPCPQPPHGRPG